MVTLDIIWLHFTIRHRWYPRSFLCIWRHFPSADHDDGSQVHIEKWVIFESWRSSSCFYRSWVVGESVSCEWGGPGKYLDLVQACLKVAFSFLSHGSCWPFPGALDPQLHHHWPVSYRGQAARLSEVQLHSHCTKPGENFLMRAPISLFQFSPLSHIYQGSGSDGLRTRSSPLPNFVD